MGATARYRRVLAAPHVTRLWVASSLARLPTGIDVLAIVLAMRQGTGSFAAAGAAAGAFAAATGLTAPVLGRLIDRRGPRRTLPVLVTGHAVAMLAFVALLGSGPVWVLVVLAALAGVGLPPVSAVMRAMWQRLLGGDEELVTTAFALDAAVMEGAFIVGPLLVALTLTFSTARVALLAAVAMSLAGTAAVVASPAVRGWETEHHSHRGLFGAFRSPGLLTVFLATIPLGLSFGAMEIALAAFAAHRGHPGGAGLLIAVWGAGSMTGALVYGARSWRHHLSQRWLAITAILAAGTVLPLAAGATGTMMALLVPCGVLIAPALATGSQLMGILAPPGMTTEAYSWGPTALVGGIAAGNTIAGVLTEAWGWRSAVVLAAVMAGLSAAVGYARRRTLTGPVDIA